VSNISCSERDCDTTNEGSRAADAKCAFFPQSGVIHSELLAGIGVLTTVLASAGMGVHHHSFEKCPR